MHIASTLLLRLVMAIGLMAIAMLDASEALAQSRNCASLANTLAAIEQSGDFRSLDQLNNRSRDAENAVRQAESTYVRSGCNDAAKRGEQLNSQCRTQARAVVSAREARDALSSQSATANAVAEQRESVLQEMARFNCGGGSSASVRQRDRGSIFDQIFGGDSDFFDGTFARGDEFSGYYGYETVRTVCVRKVDGYYWPISYSTLVDYAPNDLTQCLEQCPGQDVDLYYYDNPGQEPEQMINLQGMPYTALPTAFAYRTSYDPANNCKMATTSGAIGLVASAGGGSRAMVSYAGQSFPLPMTDPRRQSQVTVVQAAVTNFVDVPLPRPRPAAPGEAPKPVVVQQAANEPERIVMFGDKRVRVVGPDTPYAPTAAEGT